MEKKELDRILKQFAVGDTSKQDQLKFNAWLQNSTDQQYEEVMTSYYSMLAEPDVFDAADIGLLNKIEHKLDLVTENKGILKLWSRIAAVAAILIMIGMGLWFFNTSRHPDAGQDPGHIMSANDIAPGTNKAILTFASGKKITLSDTKTGVVINASNLTYNDGTEVRDPAINDRHPDAGQDPGLAMNAKLLTASTPRGGTYQVILSDGTLVVLNAASSIKFPASFAKLKSRRIELSGEAYFEVAKDKSHPFIVKTDQQEVEVLGTHFNINAYNDEPAIKTTLLEGSVRVIYTSRRPDPQDDVVLKPGQQSILKANSLAVNEANIATEIAWKNGDFIFDNEDFESILRKVEKWYNVEFQYKKGSLEGLKIGGSVSRSKNISSVLQALEVTGQVKFKIEGRRIVVMQ